MIARGLHVTVALMLAGSTLSAQVPRPFPQPIQPPPVVPGPSQPARPSAPPPPGTAKPVPDLPTEAMLGVPIHPAAQFITSYEAGRGQRFYLFGVGAPFLEIVTYYRTSLKQKGETLFESPPTHQFETGRFRDETMAFPPSVTIKDYTWGGSTGYPNPKRGIPPERFATLIQIVPAPQGAPQDR